MKKKIVSMLLVAAMSVTLFGCGGGSSNAGKADESFDSKYADLEAVELIGADSTGKGAAG